MTRRDGRVGLAVAVGVGLALWLLASPGRIAPDPAAPERPAAPGAAALPPGERPDAPEAAAVAAAKPPRPVPVIRVVDEAGRPVPGAIVRTERHVVGETERDGALLPGRWCWFPGRDDEIWARAGECASAPAPWRGESIELRLAPAAAVVGLLTDAGERPTPGARILLHGEPETFTDDAGRYRIPGLRPGRTVVVASVDGVWEEATVDVPAGDAEVEANFRLGRRLATPAVLLDVRFSRPPTATPQLTTWLRSEDLPRADSLVRVPAPGEEATVEVVCPGYRTATARVRPADERLTLRLVAGGGMPERIAVVDAAGRPAPESTLLFTTNEEGLYPRGKATDDAGIYRLSACERGRFVLATGAAGASERVKIEEGADEIRLVLGPGGAVEGRVVDRATGAGVGGVRVMLSGGECFCCSFWSAETAADGTWRIERLPVGQFVRPWLPGDLATDPLQNMDASRLEALRTGRGAEVRAGAPIRMADLVVDRYETVSCRVVTEPPLPDTDVRIDSLSGLERNSRECEKQLDGALDLTFRAGPRILVLSAGRLRGILRLDLPTGGEPPVLRLPLLDVADVSLRLVLADGSPYRVANVPFVVRTEDGPTGATTRDRRVTDADGRIDVTEAFLPLAGLSFEVALADDAREGRVGGPVRIGGEEVAARLRAAGGEGIEIPVEVTPAPAALEFGVRRVVDEDGRPVAGVVFGDPDDPEDRQVSDADGLVSGSTDDPLPPWCGRPDGDRIVVTPGRRVRWRLVDPEGAPLAGVSLYAEGYCLPDADEEGRLGVWLPKKLETLSVECSEGWLPPLRLPVGEEETVVTVLPWWRTEVVVAGPAALRVEPIVRITWRSDAPDGSAPSSDYEDAGAEGDRWRTTFPMPPFPATISARSSDLRYGAELHVAAGTERVELRLAPLPEHNVVLELRDEEDRPIRNASVTTSGRRFTAGAILPPDARTDAAGRLTLRLPEGDHVLEDLATRGHLAPEVRFPCPAPDPVVVRLPAD